MGYFDKKQIYGLVILLSIVLLLPLILFSTKQKQEIRKEAEEVRKEIVFSLNPQTNDQANPWQAGYEQTVTIKMRNITADKTLRFRVVGLELDFDARVFESQTANLQCNSPFTLAGGNASKVGDNIISLVCYLPPAGNGPSQPQTLNPGAEITVGSFKVKVKSNPPGTRTEISFARTNIPEEASLEDLSKYGEKGIYYIAGVPISGTPTPTRTPTPTVTPPPHQCPNGENGNLNCDSQGLIDGVDFAILLAKWHTRSNTPMPTPNPGHRSADIAGNDNLVDGLDFAKMLANWKTH